MTDLHGLKAIAQDAVDRRRDWLISVVDDVLASPETGFREFRTAKLVGERLAELGIPARNGIAMTGLKATLDGAGPGPTVAIIGEMDSILAPGHPNADPVTGAAHACGHNAQIGMMLGAAAALSSPEVLGALSGRVVLMAVPAEEFIDVEYRWGLWQEGKLGLLSGKQEFIRLGAFDDVDMAMMVHTSSSPGDSRFSGGGRNNGHLVKYVRFMGKASHAGGSPHRGVSALQAAIVALNAVNTQRETLRDSDSVRLHGIITSGGDSANATPDDVRYEGRVRGGSLDAIADASLKVDRCLRAGALALGASVRIVSIPGYLPIRHDPALMDVFRENAVELVGRSGFVEHRRDVVRGGSTDMGDLSHIMPAIHPYTGGAVGMGHGTDYAVRDYEQAVIRPAKAMAMAAIDLLANGAAKGLEVLARSTPPLTKQAYLDLQESRLDDELYEGRY